MELDDLHWMRRLHWDYQYEAWVIDYPLDSADIVFTRLASASLQLPGSPILASKTGRASGGVGFAVVRCRGGGNGSGLQAGSV